MGATCFDDNQGSATALRDDVGSGFCQDGVVIKSAFLRVYTTEPSASREPVPGFVRGYGMLSEEAAEVDRVAEWDGQRVVCPTNLRLRVLESTVAFANAFRGIGVGIIPEEAAQAADRELHRYHQANPDHRSHVLTSAWHVPVRWFTVFEPSEREIYDGPDGVRIRFRTSIEDARTRTRRAHQVLESLGAFEAPVEELGQLISWLEPFDDDSMVELDYDDVSDLFDSQELVFDDSCELIQQSVDALESGNMEAAGEGYGKVVSRWAHAFSLSFSN